jgi:hypothetical protein
MTSTVLAVLGSLGGLAAFGVAMWTIVRAIFKQVGATEDNTKALGDMRGALERLDNTVRSQGERISALEGQQQR